MRQGLLLRDSKTMFVRSLKLSFRHPSTIGLSLLMPATLLAVFVYVFGGAMDVGGYSVVDYIVPGIILLTIGQGAPSISVRLTNDVAKGVIDRFRTMPIAQSSLLVGHVAATVLQSIVTTAIAVLVSILVGFRSQAGLAGWLIVAGIVVLYIIMMMWLAVLIGMYAKTAEEASGLMTLIGVLPFLSSGFVPTETMPPILRIFAENQPMTSIIDTVRSLLLNEPLSEKTLCTALLWCVGLAIVFWVAALHMYKRKTTE
ncbi:ABC transporter permease [Enterococcus sp. DIV0756]|uniref:ABC transporter permease n=1 Tax=Enterococcus sp. DIV0756 TaxID=2774636 RepID=UPI003F1F5F2F